MSEYHYLRWDVFTDRPLAGNQLAVLLEAGGIEPGLMQRIANEFALPETTFVLPPESADADCRVRIFTPARELPMAGHPTIGTAFALAHSGRIAPGTRQAVFELGIGPMPVTLEWESDRLENAWMSQPAPEFGARLDDLSTIAAALGVRAEDIDATALPVQVVSSGVPFLFVPLHSRAVVDSIELDRARLVEACGQLDSPELPVYVFTLETGDDDATTYSRMFAPVFGIAEDPATGGASGPLAAYLARYCPTALKERETLLNLQGVRMNRPSSIHLSVSADAPPGSPVLVGGKAVLVGEGRLFFQ
ncbi:MAG: PhzF family phenazine biosynthesis protein [Gammaproteobacteria bacterium]|nr:PhzF family phenazine biosynthesis protein [Gammaproteobacteria bacterium]